MKEQIERFAAVLTGKTLWRCLRAADMATFAFGERRQSVDWKGSAREVGEWALHVQCAWRIRQGSQILVGDRDLHYPAGYRQGDIVPDEFDWDRQPNLRDELLESLFKGVTPKFIVSSVEVGVVGSLHLELTGDLYLDIFPNDSASGEYWRLFEPDKNLPHLVVTSRGIER